MAKQSQLDKAIAVFELQRSEHLRHAEIMGIIINDLRGLRSAKPAKPRKQKASPATRAMSELEQA